jgi:hypothetical protein
MFAIILAGITGLAVAAAAAAVAAQWAYLLAGPLLGSVLGLAAACVLAARPAVSAREDENPGMDPAADVMVARLRDAGARLARYEACDTHVPISRRSASS